MYGNKWPERVPVTRVKYTNSGFLARRDDKSVRVVMDIPGNLTGDISLDMACAEFDIEGMILKSPVEPSRDIVGSRFYSQPSVLHFGE